MTDRSPMRRLLDTLQAMIGMRIAVAVDMLALYRAKLVAQSADLSTVDLQPDDARIPGVGKVPLTLGLPGCTVQVAQGAYMLLGWRGGDPAQPYAVPCWESGASVTKLVLAGTTVHIGAESGSQPSALGDTLETRLDAIEGVLNGHIHSGVTTGMGSTGVLVTALPTQPDVRASNARVK